MNRALSCTILDCPMGSRIDWNIEKAWVTACEGIIRVEVNTTVPWAVYLSR